MIEIDFFYPFYWFEYCEVFLSNLYYNELPGWLILQTTKWLAEKNMNVPIMQRVQSHHLIYMYIFFKVFLHLQELRQRHHALHKAMEYMLFHKMWIWTPQFLAELCCTYFGGPERVTFETKVWGVLWKGNSVSVHHTNIQSPFNNMHIINGKIYNPSFVCLIERPI